MIFLTNLDVKRHKDVPPSCRLLGETRYVAATEAIGQGFREEKIDINGGNLRKGQPIPGNPLGSCWFDHLCCQTIIITTIDSIDI